MAASVQETTIADQKAIFLTVYEQDTALVKDVRDVALNAGSVKLQFSGVSERIQPETALLFSQGRSGIRVSQVYFDTHLLTPQNLLKSYVGKDVGVIRTNPANGEETREVAKLLSAQDGVVLQLGNRIETTVPGRIVFDRVPPGMQASPVLTVELQSPSAGKERLELDYLTSGLSWQANYVAELDAEGKRMNFSGWAMIANRSETPFENAGVQLVAGSLNRATAQPVMFAALRSEAKIDAAAPNDTVAEEAFADYHLYTVPGRVTIAANQSRQFSLLAARDVRVKKEWVVNGNAYSYQSRLNEASQALPVGVYIDFDNRKGAGFGVALPKGVVRFYQKDRQGHLQLVGESRLPHTPVDGSVRLKLGEAFDVTATRKQTAFESLPSTDSSVRISESAYEIVLKNAKPERVTVQVRESIPGSWKIVQENEPHTRDGTTAVWNVKVPAKGQTTLRYRVRVE